MPMSVVSTHNRTKRVTDTQVMPGYPKTPRPSSYPTPPDPPTRPSTRKPRLTRPPRLEPPRSSELPRQLELIAAPVIRRVIRALGRNSSEGQGQLFETTARIPEVKCQDFGPTRTPRANLANPAKYIQRIAQMVIEVMVGRRSVQQLAGWLSSEKYEDLATAFPGSPRRTVQTRIPHLLTMRVCEPGDGVAEASVVVRDGAQAYAMALRLEGLDGDWKCTVLEFI